jgi:hypothetical protein
VTIDDRSCSASPRSVNAAAARWFFWQHGLVRRSWVLGSVAGLLVGWGCGAGAFTCSDDSQCQGGPADGSCVEGYCAFPSDVCGSGLQYGEHAGSVSGTCVPAGADTEPSSSSEGTSDAAPGTSTFGEEGPLDTSDTGEASTGGPPSGAVELRDDALRGEFEAGTMRGVEWAGDRLTLSPAATQGTFTSRVFDAGAPAQWQTVQWQPDGPYGKPLPEGGGAEVDYLADAVDMAGNVLLMHFDGQGAWEDGLEVQDDSGAGNHGLVVSGGGPIGLVPGVFGTALDDHALSRISISTADAPGLAFGEDDFTWSLWFRMNEACVSNHVYMGVDDSDDRIDVTPHLWLGCTDDAWTECAGEVTAPRVGGVLRSVHDDSSDGGYYCSASAIDGDVWRHVVVVKQGHAQSLLSIYVNGALENEAEVDFAAPLEYPNEPDFAIGAFSRGTYPAVGVFDEAAVWRRALGPEEVAAVYRRGAMGLQVSVRACSDAACADDPPFGPAQVDPPQALAPGTELPLPELLQGRYVQYRLELSGDGQGPGPALRSVAVRGVR